MARPHRGGGIDGRKLAVGTTPWYVMEGCNGIITGSLCAAGNIVRLTGISGTNEGRPTFSFIKASAGAATTLGTHVVVQGNKQNGFITAAPMATRLLVDTSGYTDGYPIYLQDAAGTIGASAGTVEQKVGIAYGASTTAGSMWFDVRPVAAGHTAPSAGASDAFKTFTCSSGTHPVADTSTDEMTITGTSPIVCTGSSSADSITFSLAANTITESHLSTTLDISGVTLTMPTSQALTSPAITGGTAIELTGLSIRSTGTGAFDLIFANSEDLTSADKTLTIKVNDANRALELTGDVTFAGAVTTAGDFTTAGAYAATLTFANTTNATFPTGTITVCDLTSTQTLAAKTLTQPTVADLTNMQHAHTGATSGGAISAVAYGVISASGQTDLAAAINNDEVEFASANSTISFTTYPSATPDKMDFSVEGADGDDVWLGSTNEINIQFGAAGSRVSALALDDSAILTNAAVGATAGKAFYAETQDGGTATTTGSAGGLFNLKTGDGSAGTSANAGGAGGALAFSTGDGGNSVTGTPAASGAITIGSGTGGERTTSGQGAVSGNVTISTGTGGDATSAGAGGAAGAIALNGGSGGADAASTGGGAGGAVTLAGGTGGTSSGTNGAGGAITIDAGASSGGTNGAINIGTTNSVLTTIGIANAGGVTIQSLALILDSENPMTFQIGAVDILQVDETGISSFAGDADTPGHAFYMETEDGGASTTGRAGGLFNLKTGDGSDAGTGTNAAGAGGALALSTGDGGSTATGTIALSGAVTIASGTGGAATGAAAAAASGVVTISSGTGGLSTTSGDGGAAGTVTLSGGTGGGGSSTDVGGAGGAIALSGGTGGTSASGTEGDGGAVTIDGGAAGSGGGAAGTNGTITIGGTNASATTVGRVGAATTVTALGLTLNSVNEMNLTIGGQSVLAIDDLAITGNTGGSATAGKGVFIETQDGGTASAAGPAGGAYTFKTGDGANGAVGANNGGAGGAISITTGTGGDTGDTASDGADGGAITMTAGSGGAGGASSGTDGDGGAVSIDAGAAGSGGNVAGTPGIITIGATNASSVLIGRTTVADTYISGNRLFIDSTTQMSFRIGATDILALDDGPITGFAGASNVAGQDLYIETEDGGPSTSTNAGTAGALLSIKTGDGSQGFATENQDGAAGGALTITTGAGGAAGLDVGGTADGKNGGAITVAAGAGGLGGATSGTGGDGGAISIDAGNKGSANTDGAVGAITIGTTYAASVTIGKAAVTTTLQGNVNISGVPEAAIADGDYFLFLDGGTSSALAKEAVADLATLFAGAAGSGLTATSSRIAVDVNDATAAVVPSITSGAPDFGLLADASDSSATKQVDLNALVGQMAGTGLHQEATNGKLEVDTDNPSAYWVMHEDFTFDSGATEPLPWAFDVLASATADFMDDEPAGVYQLAIESTNEAQAAQITWGNHYLIDTDMNPVVEFRVRVDNINGLTSVERIAIGLVKAHTNSEDALDAIDHSCWFLMKGAADVKIYVESDDGTTDTDDQDSTITLSDDTWTTFKIDMSTLADVTMSIDGVEQSGGTLDMTQSLNQVLQPIVVIQRDDATQTEVNTEVEIDYVNVKADRA